MIAFRCDQLFHGGGPYLLCKSMDLFLYDRDLRHEELNIQGNHLRIISDVISQKNICMSVSE